MLAALVAYKVSSTANNPSLYSTLSLGWLPLNLECMETHFLPLESCPRLPFLRKLDIQRSYWLPSRPLSPMFPTLREIHFPSHLTHHPYFAANNPLPAVLGDLPALTDLRLVSFSANDDFQDFSVPPACRIRYSLTIEPSAMAPAPNLNIATLAPNLARNLQWLRLQLIGTDLGQPGILKLDLGVLRDCPVLEEVRIEQGTFSYPLAGNLMVCGFEHLPAACKRVVLVPNPGRAHRDGGLPFVKPTHGWEVVLGTPGVEFFDPEAWQSWLRFGWEPTCPAFVHRVGQHD